MKKLKGGTGIIPTGEEKSGREATLTQMMGPW